MNLVYGWREIPEAEFAVIGDPVNHSLSPAMHAAAYRELGLNHRYVAVHAPRGLVRETLDRLRTLGYVGVNVTLPHKEEAMNWCDEVDSVAKRIGAANTLDMQAKHCTNTDGNGFLETLKALPLINKEALLLGAGGSARAVAFALADAGWSLRIFNRTEDRGRNLADEVGAVFCAMPEPQGVGLIVNSTSASLAGEDIVVPWDAVPSDAIAYDLMYGRELTPFLRHAHLKGLQTIDGLPMLVAQGALSLEWWLKVKAPRQAMLDALR